MNKTGTERTLDKVVEPEWTEGTGIVRLHFEGEFTYGPHKAELVRKHADAYMHALGVSRADREYHPHIKMQLFHRRGDNVESATRIYAREGLWHPYEANTFNIAEITFYMPAGRGEDAYLQSLARESLASIHRILLGSKTRKAK